MNQKKNRGKHTDAHTCGTEFNLIKNKGNFMCISHNIQIFVVVSFMLFSISHKVLDSIGNRIRLPVRHRVSRLETREGSLEHQDVSVAIITKHIVLGGYDVIPCGQLPPPCLSCYGTSQRTPFYLCFSPYSKPRRKVA